MKKLLLAGTILAAIGAVPARADNVALFMWNGLATDNGSSSGSITLSSSSLGDITITKSKATRLTNPNGLGEANIDVENSSTTQTETLNILAGANGFSSKADEFKLTGAIFNLVGKSTMSASYFVDSTNSLNGLSEIVTGTDIKNWSSPLLTGVDSFAFNGKGFDSVGAPYGLAERLTITLEPGTSIAIDGIGMTAVPELPIWAMLLPGFGLLGLVGLKRGKQSRFAI